MQLTLGNCSPFSKMGREDLLEGHRVAGALYTRIGPDRECRILGPSEQVFRNRHRLSVNIFRIRVLDQKRLSMKTTASPLALAETRRSMIIGGCLRPFGCPEAPLAHKPLSEVL